jgi:mono/diheme cytochrome c family protein
MFSSRRLRTVQLVIASQRVGAKRRPMTGSAKQSSDGGQGRIASSQALLAMTIVAGLATSPLIAAETGYYGCGKPATPAEIAGWDIDVRGDDGAGLPPGKGSAARGVEVYADQCAVCHGTFGEGEGRFPKLVGGIGTLKHDRPELTVGSYWPFAPTLWDYINRAMPMPAPHTLSADDVYALTAYILNLNDIVSSDFVADRDSLPKVKMPNRDSFVWTDPRPDTMATPCMRACADLKDIFILSTAEGRNLTPRTTGPLDMMLPK